jgi:UDP-N-acetylmuramoyl-L-alanyl-D-glutamate--2,6-diaminopimelate ligase
VKLLDQLLEDVPGANWSRERTAGLRVHRLSDDSRETGSGGLFVAIRGTTQDSHQRIPEAVRNGAIAVIVERDVPDPGVPVIRVESARRALAELAASWYGSPGRRLDLVGITGTLGKTSVLSMLENALQMAGLPVATIGSLGVRLPGSAQEDTGHTVPGPLVIHESLARAEKAGARIVAMEVTSHALMQDRVHGLEFQLGIFTNLVPLEHLEYHGSFEEYAQAKSRFFDHLRPGAPLIYSGGDPVLQSFISDHEVLGVACGRDHDAAVQVRDMRIEPERTSFTLVLERSLPCIDCVVETPARIPLEVRLLGRANTNNAALAAAAAFCLGADASAVRSALSIMEAPPRRMKLVHHDRILVLDDTVGHPDSITAVFEVAESLPHRELHVVFAIRGQRGTAINRGDAEALSVWAERVGVSTLLVTRSLDTADDRNAVADEERDAFVSRLQESGSSFREHDLLNDAIEEVIRVAKEGDLVLLLGAQGMDAGAELALQHLQPGPGLAEAARSPSP